MSDAKTPTTLPAADTKIPRKRVFSWALWDWATQPFNSVIITFIFTALYLTRDSFIDPAIAALGEGNELYDSAIAKLSAGLGLGITLAGVLVALLAPVIGQRADASGRRKAWLGISTIILVLSMLGLFFVEAAPTYFVLGVGLIAIGSVVSEIAGVNYNAMIVQVSTPRNVGRVSGMGWGFGYLGGIIALVLVVIANGADWWGMSTENGLAYRMIAVGCAVWTILFAWPVFAFVPEAPASKRASVNFLQGYVVLWNDLKELWNNARATLWFLLASAIYRDGLAGIFTFGAIIAASAFGFEPEAVIMFGIAANLIAGISTWISGLFDDRFGPRAVILFALIGIVISGLIVVAFHNQGAIVFWIFGLMLTAFVGPAQSASRSLLARVSPKGRETEIFGLYATTGRAASFLAPAMWTLFIVITGATIWGTLGVILVVLAGLILLAFVKVPGSEPVR